MAQAEPSLPAIPTKAEFCKAHHITQNWDLQSTPHHTGLGTEDILKGWLWALLAVLKKTDTVSQHNGKFWPLVPKSLILLPFLSLSDALRIAWSPLTPFSFYLSVHLSLPSCPYPPKILVNLSVGLYHPHTRPWWGHPLHHPISRKQPAPLVHNIIYYRPGRLHLMDKLPLLLLL